MCHHTQEPTVLSRLSCRPPHLNVDRFHQPCLLPWRVPLLPPIHGWLLGRTGEDCRPRVTRGIATPTRRYHGRMLIHPSTCVCHPGQKVFAHTQVRDPRESAAACCTPALRTPSLWPRAMIPGKIFTSFAEF